MFLVNLKKNGMMKMCFFCDYWKGGVKLGFYLLCYFVLFIGNFIRLDRRLKGLCLLLLVCSFILYCIVLYCRCLCCCSSIGRRGC